MLKVLILQSSNKPVVNNNKVQVQEIYCLRNYLFVVDKHTSQVKTNAGTVRTQNVQTFTHESYHLSLHEYLSGLKLFNLGHVDIREDQWTLCVQMDQQHANNVQLTIMIFSFFSEQTCCAKE